MTSPAVLLLSVLLTDPLNAGEPIDIGSRREPMIDDGHEFFGARSNVLSRGSAEALWRDLRIPP